MSITLKESLQEAYMAGFVEACHWPIPVPQDTDSLSLQRRFQRWYDSVEYASAERNPDEDELTTDDDLRTKPRC